MKKTIFTWNPIIHEPGNINLPILAITENDKLVVFKDTKTFLNGDTKHPISGFSRLVEKYNLKWWVYQSYIINNDYDDYED